MQYDDDEEGASFDLSPDEMIELAVHISKLKTTGSETKAVQFFRKKLFGYVNPMPEFHRRMADEKHRK